MLLTSQVKSAGSFLRLHGDLPGEVGSQNSWRVWELTHAGYDANWFCYIASHATEHATELDRQTIQRILALPGDLWLDVCGDDTDN